MTPTYTDHRRKGAKHHPYYECNGRNKKGSAFCDAKMLPAEAIDEALMRIIYDIILQEDELNSILNDSREGQLEQLDDMRSRKDELTWLVASTKDKLNRVFRMMEDGKLNSGTD